MDIDKLIRPRCACGCSLRFGSLMDIDKLIHAEETAVNAEGFGSLMDIDKLIHAGRDHAELHVLVL